QAVTIPVVAIGGINKRNMMELQGTGVAGVALVSGIFASPNITSQCEELLKLSQAMVGQGQPHD
ncbi:MAG: thiamine phosphate synthase, partial [Clostridiales bacterium]